MSESSTLENGVVMNAWRGYAATVMPETAGDIQIQETRRAFFAGAGAVIALVAAIGDKDVDEQCAFEVLTDLYNEVNEFKDRVGKDF